jgi:branched-chain amino acid aminotransferase
MSDFVAINGHLCRPEEAKISVFDRGFLYGDGIYEVTRSYGRVLFALEEHIDRLYNSARLIALDIGYEKTGLIKELYRLYKQVNRDDIYMRVIITRGEGQISLDPAAATKPNMVVIFKDLPPIDAKLYDTGVDVITASIQRNPKKSLDPNIKSGNYLNNILAMAEAKKQGAYDALMVNREGHVTEGTTWNVLMVKGGVVVTPPDEADILHGITRKILKKLCKQNDILWQERFFAPDELKAADEVFLSSSLREVLPIRSVDGKSIGNGKPGPVAERLAGIYKQYVREYCAKAVIP